MAQGEMVAEIIAGARRVWDKRSIPAVCFTDPEVVSVGMSAAQAGGDARVAQFPFSANGRAMTLEADAGFVRIVAHGVTHEIVGIQAVGPGVSELSAAFALAIEMGARLEDIGAVVQPHPTLSEAFPEAALRGLGHPIHL
jgi:dihydrolipoamide dehydrogenase